MESIRKLTDTLAKDGNQVIERAEDMAQSMLDKSRETLKELRTQGMEAIDQVQENSQKAWDGARKLVQKHPAKSLGLVLLAGVLVGGVLMAMRKSD
jgi:ElaB/YqjD/DUF883 family membrane-anchored ribosome-binding protein